MTDIATPAATADAEEIVVRGNRLRMLASGVRMSVVDYTAPAGFPGPPLHVHPGFDELFVVLEGVLTLRAGADVRELGPGESLHVPGSVPHTFANPADAPVRFLCACSPGGFEAYFRALADGDEPRAAAVAERFGYAVAGKT